MILTLTDFQKNSFLELPHAKPAPGGADNTSKIQLYIDKFERDILIQLGVGLFDELKTSGSLDPETGARDYTGEDVPQRIKDLVLGVDYALEETEVRWEGLQNNESCLAYFIFYQFNQDSFDYKGTFGLEKVQDYYVRSVNAFNDFKIKYQQEDDEVIKIERSLYQFLEDNSEVYGKQDNFYKYGNVNRFGV